jgi:thymidylate synthase (FAD)
MKVTHIAGTRGANHHSEDLIVYMARVSNPASQAMGMHSDKLIRYLIKNKHWSPFEMVHEVFEIETSRAIARQLLRHRSFSFQEFSQRYSDEVELESFVYARSQDPSNRQSSLPTENKGVLENWEKQQDAVWELCRQSYKTALRNGIAKEVARVVLPEGLTKSRLYMAGSVRSWIHYCDLRTGNGTQLEHREIALEIRRQLAEFYPNCFNGDEDDALTKRRTELPVQEPQGGDHPQTWEDDGGRVPD